MNARKLALVALIPLVLTACGRAPSTSVEVSSDERAVPRMNFEKKDTQKAVVVDGKAFLETKAPAAFVAPAAPTPGEGKGNVRAIINVNTMGDNTFAVSFHVMKGDENVHAQLWEKDALNVTGLSDMSGDLEPGEYTLLLNRYNKVMGVYAQKSMKVTVEAGKSIDAKF